MKEKWKPIVGYEGLYEVSNMGSVRSLTRVVDFRDRAGKMNQRVIKGRVLKPQKQRTGYLHVGLSKDGKVTLFRVHRLVAVAFIDNPKGLYEVNHIDEDKTNNRADNLEWCDHKYNNNYGSKKGHIPHRKNIAVRCVETGQVYPSIRQAAIAVGRHFSTLSACLRGSTPRCAGYHWEYVGEEEE